MGPIALGLIQADTFTTICRLPHCCCGGGHPHRLNQRRFPKDHFKIHKLKIMKPAIFILALTATLQAVSPPLFDYSFHVTFDETVTVNKTVYKGAGQTFYDPKGNRERVDRTNGQHDIFCGSVLPNITTPCQHITVENKRWLVFPQRSQCCFCCDAAHGCGILKPDWLADAEYKGQEKIEDTLYDKWSKDGMVGYNYLWVTADAQIPRRLDENGHLTDYSLQSFSKQALPASIFALPTYCNAASPTNCPLESFCGKHRILTREI